MVLSDLVSLRERGLFNGLFGLSWCLAGGIGPVVAMELLNEFPGEDGLHKFKDWWLKVQSGRDKESDNVSTFRKRFVSSSDSRYLMALDF